MAGHHQLAVDFVAHHLDTVLQADIVHPLQFFLRPYAPRRVVRVTEQEHCSLFIGALRLEVCPVYLEAVVVAGEPQHALRYLATVIADAGEEAVVVG